MIIVRLMGGLGNQMFQYALGRRLAHDRGCALKLDAESGFAGDPYRRQYALDAFRIQEEFAAREEIPRFMRSGRVCRRVTTLFQSFLPQNRRSIITEKEHFVFDPTVLNIKRSAYVVGYWQNEAYFKSIESIIRDEFAPRRELSASVRALMREMAECASVSVHVRRLHGVAADGKPIPDHVLLHGACSPEYFDRAISKIESLVSNPRYFIFSDDVEWCKRNMSVQPGRIVAAEIEVSDVDEFFLMASCQHHIISNSTFSWWSAWLGPNRNKVVIAPALWHQSGNLRTQELLPADWFTV